jgi:hypothetical protein
MRTLMNKRNIVHAAVAVLLALSVCCGRTAPAATPDSELAPVELSAHIDRATANPGDLITLTITADYQPDVTLEIPEIGDTLSDFRIADSGVSQPVQRGNRLVAERWYKLQADTPGSYIIEPVEAPYHLPDGAQETLKTPRLFIEIESLLAKSGEAEDIRDIKPPLAAPAPYRAILLIAALLAGSAVAVLLARKIVSRLKRKALVKATARRPAHEEALEALERLLQQGLIEKGCLREFCFGISELFRRYMQARFDFPALDLTTEEILPRIEGNGLVDGSLRPIARDLLVNTDLVKFAKHRPTRDEVQAIIENTRTFVEHSADARVDRTAPTGGGDAQ